MRRTDERRGEKGQRLTKTLFTPGCSRSWQSAEIIRANTCISDRRFIIPQRRARLYVVCVTSNMWNQLWYGLSSIRSRTPMMKRCSLSTEMPTRAGRSNCNTVVVRIRYTCQLFLSLFLSLSPTHLHPLPPLSLPVSLVCPLLILPSFFSLSLSLSSPPCPSIPPSSFFPSSPLYTTLFVLYAPRGKSPE
jgi:hypothetical protein